MASSLHSRTLSAVITLLLLVSCGSQPQPDTAPVIQLQYTFAVQPWVADILTCSDPSAIAPELRASALIALSETAMAIRMGDAGISTPAYQIGTEEIHVILHSGNPVASLTAAEVRSIFTGSIQNWQDLNGRNAPIQVILFPSGEDIQQVFEQVVLNGSSPTSLASLIPDAIAMLAAISKDENAIGILPGRGLTQEVTSVFSSINIPVLLLTSESPLPALTSLLDCLQK